MNIQEGKEDCVIEIEDDEENSLIDILVQQPAPGSTLVETEEYFEVDIKKDSVIADQADFVRIFNELQKKELEKREAEAEHKKNFIKQKKCLKKQSEKAESSTSESKNERILKAIDAHMKHYKNTNNPNFLDTEVGKLRYECREKIFKALLYGVEELKELKPNELKSSEEKITKMLGKEVYAYCKTLTIEIDNWLLDELNSGNKQTACKKYKSHIKTFSFNLGEESNFELRQKVLSRELTPKLIGESNEEEFIPKHIREKMIEKENFLLREATAPEKNLMLASDEDYITQEAEILQAEKGQVQEKKEKYRFLGELSLIMLRDFLNNTQIDKMKHLLSFENRIDIEEKLQSNINQVFKITI